MRLIYCACFFLFITRNTSDIIRRMVETNLWTTNFLRQKSSSNKENGKVQVISQFSFKQYEWLYELFYIARKCKDRIHHIYSMWRKTYTFRECYDEQSYWALSPWVSSYRRTLVVSTQWYHWPSAPPPPSMFMLLLLSWYPQCFKSFNFLQNLEPKQLRFC